MIKRRLGLTVSNRMLRLTLASMALLTLISAATSRAEDSAPASDAAAASAPAVPAAPVADPSAAPPAATPGQPALRHHQPAVRRTVAQAIDDSVRRLSRGLELDPGQQEKLRQILIDQHRRLMALRSGGGAVPVDMAGTTLAIYDQTKARIRAMLNDEQKGKYSVDVPTGDLAPAQADLHHWIDLQDEKRRRADSGEGSK
jgi:hypothetical protein